MSWMSAIGLLSLWLALGGALVLGVLPLWGAQRGRADWMALAKPAVYAVWVLVVLAFASLMGCFIRDDFSLLYVASNSNSALPLAYKIAGVWGGHEGSLLLWVLMLCSWMVTVALFSRHLPQQFLSRILSVMGLIAVGFLLFMLLTSNPFDRISPAPLDGRDLNPLLQDPGMVSHPPMLYMGYVGFSVAFAFAVAALIGGQLDAAWARWTRPWTTLAWLFLTLGIALGSTWAYYELGWGGWWFWDPVENASLMPWLVGTALIHSLAVTEKRGSFKSWTVLLAILAFSFSLLGTFLVRSGVLSSVHAFATDPRRGLFVLLFLAVVVGTSLTLYAWRAPSVGLGERFALVSKETALLLNNVLFLVAAASVLLGTLYPLLLDALGLGKISVGPPYFDTVFVPLMAPVVFLMGVGPLLRWRQAEMVPVLVRLRWAAGVAVAASLLTGWLAGEVRWLSSLGLLMGYWIVSTTLADVWQRVRHAQAAQGWGGVPAAIARWPRGLLGMWLAHLGVAVFCVGVTMVKTYEVERDVLMRQGDQLSVQGYTFRMEDTREVRGPNYVALRARLVAQSASGALTTLYPEKRVYRVQQNPMTEAAIDAGVTRDLYVSLGDQQDDGSWVVRVYVKPFVNWIWAGCLLMALGGLWAALDKRYRKALPGMATSATTPEVRA